MSINFPQDTSTQLSYSSFPFTTTTFDGYTTSNYVSNVSNILQTNINTKENILTFTSPITRTTNTISLNESAITTLTNFYNKTQIDTNIYTKTQADNLLATKDAILTFTSPLTRTTNTITFNESAITSLTNFYNKTTSDGRYLQLAGGAITGNLDINGTINTPSLNLTTPLSTSIYSIFSSKVPWAMYFAEDFNYSSPTVLPNYISNGRDATLAGTITKTTASGNGATGNITYISGGTTATISFPIGSIPTNFTILSLTRYNGASTQRILQSQSGNWLHGHWQNKRGVAFYEGWKTDQTTTGTLNDWLCFIGKNGGSTPNNILADGVGRGIATGGTGNYRLGVNINNPYGTSEASQWALSCVMIWESHLTDAEMLNLNTIINNYKNDGISIKTIINSTINDETIIESRVYSGAEKTELLLFKGNNATGTDASDRIRLKAANIAFDTYNTDTTATNRTNENIIMIINEVGNVGIGTLIPNALYKLDVNGAINTTNLYKSGVLIDFSTYATTTQLNAKENILTFSSPLTRTTNTISFTESAITTLTNFYNKTETNNLLATKDAILTFTSPLTRTINTISFTESAITTLTNFYNKTGSDGRYFQLSGGSITGDLTINKTNANIQLTGTNGYNIAVPSTNAFFSSDALANDMVIRSVNKLLLLSGSGSSAITINTLNNVGIGTTNPSNILQVGDGARLRISNGITDYSLIGTKNVDDATNTRIVISGNTRTTFAGNIDYYSTSATGKHLFIIMVMKQCELLHLEMLE